MPVEEIIWTKDGGYGVNGIFTLGVYSVDDDAADACESFELQPLEWSFDPDGHSVEIVIGGVQVWHKDKHQGEFKFAIKIANRGPCPDPWQCWHNAVSDIDMCRRAGEELESDWTDEWTPGIVYETSDECDEECGELFGTTTCSRKTRCYYHVVEFTVDPDGHLIFVSECGTTIWNVNAATTFYFDFDHMLQERSDDFSDSNPCPPPPIEKFLASRIRTQFDADGHCEWISKRENDDCLCGVETACHPDSLPHTLLAVTSLPFIGTIPVTFGASPLPGGAGSGWSGEVTYECLPEGESRLECVKENIVTLSIYLACNFADTLCAWFLYWKCSNYPGDGQPALWHSCFAPPITDPCVPFNYPGCDTPPACDNVFELRWCEGTPGNNCPPNDPEIHQCCVYASSPIGDPNPCPDPPPVLCITFIAAPPGF